MNLLQLHKKSVDAFNKQDAGAVSRVYAVDACRAKKFGFPGIRKQKSRIDNLIQPSSGRSSETANIK